MGLVPPPKRTGSNYRDYAQEHVDRLHFIRRSRSLGMELEEIRTLLRFEHIPQDDCGGVNEVVDQHIAHVAQRLRQLPSLEAQLRTLRQQCRLPKTLSDAAS